MSASYLILHGIENERPPQHWQFQLAAELVRRGHDVRYPALPQPSAPTLTSWLAALSDELNALTGEQRNVICHSLACLLWFHAAARLSDGRALADRVLLVSPPASDRVPEAGKSFRVDALDTNAARRSAKRELAIVCSDADPYNPAGAQTLYAQPLGIQATIVPGAGHITPAEGFGRWRFAEQWCKVG
jgi:predicted alpha/beta hydrolase family esterase